METTLYYMEETHCLKSWFWDNKTNYATADWTGFHLWHVLSGCGRIETAADTFILRAGDTFLFDLDTAHHCTHDPEDPLAVIALHFECSDLAPGSRFYPHSGFLGELSRRALHFYRTEDAENRALWFRALLSELVMNQTPPPKLSGITQQMIAYIRAHCTEPLDLQRLAILFSYSPNHITRRFRRETGMTPGQFLHLQRTEYAKNRMLYSDRSLTEIAAELGYSDQSHFTKHFRKIAGIPPSVFREQARRQRQPNGL